NKRDKTMQYIEQKAQQRWVVFGKVVIVGSLLAHHAAHAGRPMEVDDAGIVGPGACELEAWSEHRKHSNGYWVMPACNFTGNLELELGGAVERPDEGANTNTLAVAAKSVLAEGLG